MVAEPLAAGRSAQQAVQRTRGHRAAQRRIGRGRTLDGQKAPVERFLQAVGRLPGRGAQGEARGGRTEAHEEAEDRDHDRRLARARAAGDQR